ncbi:hypothetical protein MA5S0422_3515 [Mycobacteroides abscessus 5S-0422]|uniref:Uncharacterized protein n=1 Tax=Mycobacteroides abscessus subsp. bolletii 1513 TaxID=1299321 RepID=X8DY21_9MYCO|nr:hypothetical protein MA5S0422_3515 [Mycobacteroides abscessus 5S-0422]EIU24938.1 hypothetical protein MA5S0817_4404 [Mycobacteroides abscessus 5S-0817]EIU31500.1 hypothetical protein MA5S1212_5271 [Mycobacteroides abscessus 5S-1212]EIU50194.1 hypothetical protein MA5S1215_0169 [Mycobacteroides abscessus 5S-1215]EIV01669.1 hypothetical protein MA5S0921_0357 [Mycobacteroides abscessus 5S-0921]EUA73552.1 hypothetical protein I540_0273 [Mycobacteroides abscessus subsp. bolletii 1513]
MDGNLSDVVGDWRRAPPILALTGANLAATDRVTRCHP